MELALERTLRRKVERRREAHRKGLVRFSWFVARPSGPRPDLSDFKMVDSGQTIKLGNYEAASSLAKGLFGGARLAGSNIC